MFQVERYRCLALLVSSYKKRIAVYQKHPFAAFGSSYIIPIVVRAYIIPFTIRS